ncbi:MAG: hypothetical protein WCW01_00890 [Gammaproteobacteria bacterium]
MITATPSQTPMAPIKLNTLHLYATRLEKNAEGHYCFQERLYDVVNLMGELTSGTAKLRSVRTFEEFTNVVSNLDVLGIAEWIGLLPKYYEAILLYSPEKFSAFQKDMADCWNRVNNKTLDPNAVKLARKHWDILSKYGNELIRNEIPSIIGIGIKSAMELVMHEELLRDVPQAMPLNPFLHEEVVVPGSSSPPPTTPPPTPILTSSPPGSPVSPSSRSPRVSPRLGPSTASAPLPPSSPIPRPTTPPAPPLAKSPPPSPKPSKGASSSGSASASAKLSKEEEWAPGEKTLTEFLDAIDRSKIGVLTDEAASTALASTVDLELHMAGSVALRNRPEVLDVSAARRKLIPAYLVFALNSLQGTSKSGDITPANIQKLTDRLAEIKPLEQTFVDKIHDLITDVNVMAGISQQSYKTLINLLPSAQILPVRRKQIRNILDTSLRTIPGKVVDNFTGFSVAGSTLVEVLKEGFNAEDILKALYLLQRDGSEISELVGTESVRQEIQKSGFLQVLQIYAQLNYEFFAAIVRELMSKNVLTSEIAAQLLVHSDGKDYQEKLWKNGEDSLGQALCVHLQRDWESIDALPFATSPTQGFTWEKWYAAAKGITQLNPLCIALMDHFIGVKADLADGVFLRDRLSRLQAEHVDAFMDNLVQRNLNNLSNVGLPLGASVILVQVCRSIEILKACICIAASATLAKDKQILIAPLFADLTLIGPTVIHALNLTSDEEKSLYTRFSDKLNGARTLQFARTLKQSGNSYYTRYLEQIEEVRDKKKGGQALKDFFADRTQPEEVKFTTILEAEFNLFFTQSGNEYVLNTETVSSLPMDPNLKAKAANVLKHLALLPPGGNTFIPGQLADFTKSLPSLIDAFCFSDPMNLENYKWALDFYYTRKENLFSANVPKYVGEASFGAVLELGHPEKKIVDPIVVPSLLAKLKTAPLSSLETISSDLRNGGLSAETKAFAAILQEVPTHLEYLKDLLGDTNAARDIKLANLKIVRSLLTNSGKDKLHLAPGCISDLKALHKALLPSVGSEAEQEAAKWQAEHPVARWLPWNLFKKSRAGNAARKAFLKSDQPVVASGFCELVKTGAVAAAQSLPSVPNAPISGSTVSGTNFQQISAALPAGVPVPEPLPVSAAIPTVVSGNTAVEVFPAPSASIHGTSDGHSSASSAGSTSVALSADDKLKIACLHDAFVNNMQPIPENFEFHVKVSKDGCGYVLSVVTGKVEGAMQPNEKALKEVFDTAVISLANKRKLPFKEDRDSYTEKHKSFDGWEPQEREFFQNYLKSPEVLEAMGPPVASAAPTPSRSTSPGSSSQ